MSGNSEVLLGAGDYSLEPVPAEARRGLLSTIAVIAGFVISTTPFVTSGILARGLGFSEAAFALVTGTLITASVAALSGNIGYTTGLTAYVWSRMVYGVKGSSITSVMLGTGNVAFVGLLSGMLGSMYHSLLPWLPSWVASILFLAVATAICIYGYRALAWVGTIAVPLLLGLGIYALWTVDAYAGGVFDNLFTAVPEGAIALGAAITIIVGDWITGASSASDVFRFSRQRGHVVAASYIGWVGCYCFFTLLGLITYIGVGNSDVVVVMQTLGLTFAATIIFTLSILTTMDVSLYSFSLAFTNLSAVFGLKSLNRPVWVLIGSALAVILAIQDWFSLFQPFLYLVGIVAPAFVGVVLSHFYILGRLRASREEQTRDIPAGFDGKAIAALVFGALVAYLIEAGIPALQGLVASAVAYALLEKGWRPK